MSYNEEIGGYFGIWLPESEPLHAQATAFHSARSGFRAVLEACNKSVIYIPSYVCDSVIKAAEDSGYSVRLYAINQQFMPLELPAILSAEALLLYVNYFGLCDNQVGELLHSYPAEQVIIDNSHALYSPVTDALATIYSPRKFVGLPDGGLVYASENVMLKNDYFQDDGTLSRINYLLLRYGYGARAGYSAFNQARESLADNSPKAMSALTKRLMCSIPWQQFRLSRQQNFIAVHNIFANINLWRFQVDTNVAPLCYPLRIGEVSVANVKKYLADNNIFAPTYWPDVVPRASIGSIEYQLVDQTLFLPIDQRMSNYHIDILCQTVKYALAQVN